MGNKDNPRRRLRTKRVAANIGVLLLGVGLIWTAHWVLQHLTEQEELLLDYQHQLVEQGSLIDQRNEQLSNQKATLMELLEKVDHLEATLGEQEETYTHLTEQHEMQKQALRKERDALEKEQGNLQHRIDELEDALAFKQAKAKEAAVAAARKERSTPKEIAPPKVQVASNPSSPEKVAKAQPAAAKQEQPTPSRGDTPDGRVMMVESTGYIAMCDTGCTGITATGIDLRSQPHLKVIAVDPRVIPLGSKVWVEGYGYAIAGDTGGAIKGNKIDIHFPDKATAVKWGRRTIQIRVLN